MCIICARFVHDCSYFSNVQYMHKICTRLFLFPQCAIYVQDCTCFPNVQYMCKIWVRLYLFLQCALFAQDLCKIVLISPFHNICARFVQDCTSLPNMQYLHKVAGIIWRNMSRITYLL